MSYSSQKLWYDCIIYFFQGFYSNSALSFCLLGQPHLRSEDRYRHISNDRVRAPTVYPVKRKRSHERGLTLEERLVKLFYFIPVLKILLIKQFLWMRCDTFRMHFCFRRERVLSRSGGKVAQRTAPAVFSNPQSPTSTWSPTPSPTSPLPAHVYYTPAMDEPLALIKKPRKDPENTEEKSKSNAPTQIQVRREVRR